MGDIFGAIGDSINQDKGMIYGLVNNAISYAQSKKAQKRAYQYARQLQEHQYELSQKGYLESPGNMRTGLETAGYNPMLALGNVNSGASVAGGTPVNANAVDGPNLTGSALDLQRVANETNATDASVALQNEQAKTEQSKRTNLQFDSMMKDAQKHMTDKQTSWIDKEKNAQIYKDMQEAERARAEASVTAYNAETARISSNAQKTIAENESISNPWKMGHDVIKRNLKSFEKDHPYLSKTPHFKMMTNLVRYND